MQRKIMIAVLAGLISLPLAHGQAAAQGTDFMRNTGSIWVVVGVIVITLIGLFALLIVLGRRLTNIEDHLGRRNK